MIFAYLAIATAAQHAVATRTLSRTEAAQFAEAALVKQAETSRLIKGWPDERLEAELKNAESGKTKLIFQRGHGVYVEYTAPDGNLRMWYPNNINVVKGSWGVRTINGGVRTCFTYRNAINPITQVFEPTECVLPEQTLSGGDVLQSWDGDVFGLMENRIPYKKGAMDIPAPEAK